MIAEGPGAIPVNAQEPVPSPARKEEKKMDIKEVGKAMQDTADHGAVPKASRRL